MNGEKNMNKEIEKKSMQVEDEALAHVSGGAENDEPKGFVCPGCGRTIEGTQAEIDAHVLLCCRKGPNLPGLGEFDDHLKYEVHV